MPWRRGIFSFDNAWNLEFFFELRLSAEFGFTVRRFSSLIGSFNAFGDTVLNLLI